MEIVARKLMNMNESMIWTKVVFLLVFSTMILSACSQEEAGSDSGTAEFVSIFDGETLEGWEGDPAYWRVENGNLVGEVTPETILDRNTFIIWQGDMPSDFELMVEYRVSAEGNSGINYRSEPVEDVPNALRGYQADLDGRNRYTGSNYEERKRTTLASQGERTVIPAIENAGDLQAHVSRNRWGAAEVVDSLGDPDSLDAYVSNGDWNEYHIVVEGNNMKHYVNGVLMSEVTDNDTVNRRTDGMLGVQVHVGPPMMVEYRNFRLKDLSSDAQGMSE